MPAPLVLLPTYRDEDVRNADRAPPDGRLADPRAPARALRVRTRYLRDAREREAHAVVVAGGRLHKALTGDPFATATMFPGVRGLDARPPARALFTWALDGTLYAADSGAHGVGVREYVAIQRDPAGPASRALYLPDVIEVVHHSSFVAGAEVRCAGELATDASGRLRLVSSFSGHYRPSRDHLVELLVWLGGALRLEGVVAEVVGEGPVTQVDAAELARTRGRPSRFCACY